jgi:hypothetical protein
LRRTASGTRECGIRPVYLHFRGEEFSLRRAWAGNKTTAIRGQNNGDIAIFAALSTPSGGEATFQTAPMISGNQGSAGAAGIDVMQQAVILFWSAPSRIGRRIAQFVAIAAASLPDVGV